MNREKCKGCEWYGKPYWSVYNPCDNCPRDNIQVMTRWVDPTIEQLQQELNQKNKIIEKIKEDLKRRIKSYEERQNQGIELTEVMSIRLASDKYILDKIEKLEKGSEE